MTEIKWLPRESGSRYMGWHSVVAVGRHPAVPIHPVALNLGSVYHSPLNRPSRSIRQAWVFAAAVARQSRGSHSS